MTANEAIKKLKDERMFQKAFMKKTDVVPAFNMAIESLKAWEKPVHWELYDEKSGQWIPMITTAAECLDMLTSEGCPMKGVVA